MGSANYVPANHKRRRCLVCRQWFKPIRDTAKYCDSACRQRALVRRKREEAFINLLLRYDMP
jgi:hypothetical protein